ncbi:MAG: N-methyl-D-aspartate receptor NMDAR2C subunit [Candidatus Rokuibacteriota bacterium]|nr:MAG: N-methyl-D-aspartate receptor NMDAR2C subunit [Candidatus Rokubacteria bacterium]
MTEIGQWVETWRELGVGDSAELRRLHGDVLGRYSEPHRHYHTSQHLAECFEKVQDIISLAEHPAEVHVGLWFHDVIYDTQRHDNEERSADWARSAARELGASAESAQRIYDLIMFTRHAAEPAGIDAQVLVDADLSILGAPPARFQEYEAQVRREYAWVPDATFRPTRARILKEFLGRRHLYCTVYFRERYEARARRNLQHSLGYLEGPGAAE